MSNKEMLEAALSYVSKGIPVFPCNRDKSPKTSHGFKNATTDPDQIRSWWSKHPDASIGMPTGNVSNYWVFDLDLHKPGAKEVFESLLQENGPLPETRISKTGGGGHQYFFKCNGKEIPSSIGKVGYAMDVRAEGGYVILPPSSHDSGNRYVWEKAVPATEAPEWLVELVTRKRAKKSEPHQFNPEGEGTRFGHRVLEQEINAVSQSPEGVRNDRLNKAAFNLGQLIAGGEIEQTLVEQGLLKAALESGLDEQESKRTIQSGIESGMEHPRRVTVKPEPLPDELLPVAPFDFELMPESLRPWVMDICERMQCPPEFVAVPAMVGLGAVIGRKVGIRPQGNTDWTVTANQWGVLVGRPGMQKSPAIDAALAPLKRLAAQANSAYQNDMAEYEQQKIIAKLRQEAWEKEAKKALKDNPNADLKCPMNIEDPDHPILRRYIANDTTPESLGELLRQNPNGILAFRDELVSLLKGLDREDRAEGRGFYLTGWNGDSAYTFDRIGRGLHMHIEAVCLSLFGGTQPGRLSEYIRIAVKGGSADDGLIQRFGLMVWPDTSAEWKEVDRWPDNEAKNRAFQVYDMLDRLDPMAIGASQDTDIDGDPEGMPYLRFEPTALELFQEWRANLEVMLRGGLHPALESHFAKYRKLIPSLALIIHLADGNHGPVTKEATLKALAWGEYLQTHAYRAYASASMPEVGVAKAILKRVKSGDLKSPFSSRDVWRPGWSKLTDRDQVAEALKMLEDYGWVITERIQTGGRTATLYHVHEEALR